MGKSIVKLLKGKGPKNNKNSESEGNYESPKVKKHNKFGSILSRWSSHFGKTSSSTGVKGGRELAQNLEESLPIPQIPASDTVCMTCKSAVNFRRYDLDGFDGSPFPPSLSSGFRASLTFGRRRETCQQPKSFNLQENDSPQELHVWNGEESITVSSEKLSVPSEPARELSKIILSPTKTGFKAVLASYDINSSLSHTISKDFGNLQEQIENRRKLTLVFDVNQRTFEEIGVGKSRSGVNHDRRDENETGRKDISTSALFVRNDPDELVESAGFLEAQLSVDDMTVKQSTLYVSDKKSINLQTRHLSCKSIERSRMAIKTISEPLWHEREKIRRDNFRPDAQDLLKQFIFLERDDSFANFQRIKYGARYGRVLADVKEHLPEKETRGTDRGNREIRHDTRCDSSRLLFLPGRFPDSARNVAPNLLVNIKPFKEYIGSGTTVPCHHRSFERPGKVMKKVRIDTSRTNKEPSRPDHKALKHDQGTISQEQYEKSNRIVQKQNTKSRLYLCIKCGSDVRNKSKNLARSSLHFDENMMGSQDNVLGSRKSIKSSIMVSGREDDLPCDLCPVWKVFRKKSSFSSSTIQDSLDDILKEIENYDHDLVFRQNISQFRRNLGEDTVEFKKSHSSLSFAEVIELEENKMSRFKTEKVTEEKEEEPRLDDMQRVTVRVIEFFRKNNNKTVEIERVKRAVKNLQFEKVAVPPYAIIHVLESSYFILTDRESNQNIRVMAQKIEGSMASNMENTREILISVPRGPMTFFSSENPFEKFGKASMKCHSDSKLEGLWDYKKTGDWRIELLRRINDMTTGYNFLSFQSLPPGFSIGRTGDSSGNNNPSTPPARTHGIDEDDGARIREPTEEDKAEEQKKDPGENKLGNGGECSETPEAAPNGTSKKTGQDEDAKTDMLTQVSLICTDQEGTAGPETIFLTTKKETQDKRSPRSYSGFSDLEMLNAQVTCKAGSQIMFFVPCVQKIQKAIEILNSVAYDFLVMKETDRLVDGNHLRRMISYTVLSDKKYVLNGGVETVIKKKCLERKANGFLTPNRSAKDSATKESNKTGNHSLVKSKRIITVNDRVRKSEIDGGDIDTGSYTKLLDGKSGAGKLGMSLPEVGEDVNSVRFLYCNSSNGNHTCRSSMASKCSYGFGKIRESGGCDGSSGGGGGGGGSVIAVNEIGEMAKARLTDEGFYFRADVGNTNKSHDSLQESNDGTVQNQKHPMRCEVVTILKKAEGSVFSSAESGGLGSGSQNSTTLRQQSRILTASRDSVAVDMHEEDLALGSSGIRSKNSIRQGLKTSSAKMIDKIGKDVAGQIRATRSSNSGKGLDVRNVESGELTTNKEPGNPKKMSLIIMLSKRKKGAPDKNVSGSHKLYKAEHTSNDLVKLTSVPSIGTRNKQIMPCYIYLLYLGSLKISKNKGPGD